MKRTLRKLANILCSNFATQIPLPLPLKIQREK